MLPSGPSCRELIHVVQVQDIVVGNKQFTEVAKPKEIVSLLLNDDELANLENQDQIMLLRPVIKIRELPALRTKPRKRFVRCGMKRGMISSGRAGPGNSMPVTDAGDEEERDFAAPAVKSTRGKKRGGGPGRGRGRGKRRHAGDSLPDDI